MSWARFLDADSLPVCLLHGKAVIRRYLLFLCLPALWWASPWLSLCQYHDSYWLLAARSFEFRETESILKGLVSGKDLYGCCVKNTIFYVINGFSYLSILCSVQWVRKIFSLYSRIANATVSFVTYLERTFWPHDLAVSILFRSTSNLASFGHRYTDSRYQRCCNYNDKTPAVSLVGWLWYEITIMPAIGIIQVADYPCSMANRYYYLPSIGILLCWHGEYRIWLKAKK